MNSNRRAAVAVVVDASSFDGVANDFVPGPPRANRRPIARGRAASTRDTAARVEHIVRVVIAERRGIVRVASRDGVPDPSSMTSFHSTRSSTDHHARAHVFVLDRDRDAVGVSRRRREVRAGAVRARARVGSRSERNGSRPGLFLMNRDEGVVPRAVCVCATRTR
jgi:hypothetical protein